MLGWYAPTIVKMKILLQKVWKSRVEWDDTVPSAIRDVWFQWRSELPILAQQQIPRCYFPPEFHATSIQLHRFPGWNSVERFCYPNFFAVSKKYSQSHYQTYLVGQTAPLFSTGCQEILDVSRPMYVGNRVSCIIDRIPPERWRHVKGVENPADCSSHDIFPQELVQHPLWWSGPQWLRFNGRHSHSLM